MSFFTSEVRSFLLKQQVQLIQLGSYLKRGQMRTTE